MEPCSGRVRYLGDLAAWAGTAEHLGSTVEHSVLAGIQTNLYTNFMERVWRSAGNRGVSGLIHPRAISSIQRGEPVFRSQTYGRLRRHWQFLNELFLFEDVNHKTAFGVHVYAAVRTPSFLQMSYLLAPSMVDGSLESNDQSDPPGVQFAWGGWDLRPHPSRLTRVDTAVLQQWAKIFDAPGTPADEARLLRPITREHVEILGVVAQQHVRIADLGYEWSSLWHEKGAKKDGYIEWRTEVPAEWAEVILQGPHFSVANSNT